MQNQINMSTQTSITEISLDQLDSLLQENPDSIITPDNLAVGKEESNGQVDDEVTDSFENETQGLEDAPDDLFEQIENSEESDDQEDSQEVEDTDKSKDSETSDPSVTNVLTNTVQYLIQEGLWADIEGIEEMEITPEVYAELSAKQAQYAAQSMLSELIDETGDYGKAIISYIKQGGDPNEIIDLFKEQKTLDSIDTSTEDGKQIKIESYYKDVLNWKPDRIKRHLSRLIENDEIDEEFETIEEAYNTYYEEKLQEINSRAHEEERKRVEQQKAFISSIKGVLDEDPTLTNKEKNLIASSILDFKHKLNNGQKVNDFYIKFADIQANPKDYVDLVHFIMNKEAYLKKIQKKAETKANKEAFNFIKGNAALDKVKSPNIGIENGSKKTTTDFSSILKNK